MITIEFRKIVKESTQDADEFIDVMDLPCVPDVGEIVNVNSEPFRVIERGWSVSNEQPRKMWCYLRIK